MSAVGHKPSFYLRSLDRRLCDVKQPSERRCFEISNRLVAAACQLRCPPLSLGFQRSESRGGSSNYQEHRQEKCGCRKEPKLRLNPYGRNKENREDQRVQRTRKQPVQTKLRATTSACCPMDQHEACPWNGVAPTHWAYSAHGGPSSGSAAVAQQFVTGAAGSDQKRSVVAHSFAIPSLRSHRSQNRKSRSQ